MFTEAEMEAAIRAAKGWCLMSETSNIVADLGSTVHRLRREIARAGRNIDCLTALAANYLEAARENGDRCLALESSIKILRTDAAERAVEFDLLRQRYERVCKDLEDARKSRRKDEAPQAPGLRPIVYADPDQFVDVAG